MLQDRPNPEYDPSKSVEKGVRNAKAAGIGGALTTLLLAAVTVAQGGQLDEVSATAVVSAIVAVGAAAVAGLGEWWRNRKKHGRIRPAGRLPLVLLVASLALSGALTGCITTTARDGTVTRSVDNQGLFDAVDAAFATWDRLEARRQALEAQREAARAAQDAEALARLDAELKKLEPELSAAWSDIQAKNPMLLRIWGTERAQGRKYPVE